MSGVTCDTNSLSPEDFLKKVLRKDGNGNYAIAVNDLTGSGTFVNAASCNDGLTWKDVLMLVYDQTKEAINIVDET